MVTRVRFGTLALVLLTSACTSTTSDAEPTPTEAPSTTADGSKGAGLQAQALLQESSFSEPFANGYGDLEPAFGDSLDITPEDARTVSFVFVCTGDGQVSMKVGPDRKAIEVPCNESFLRESIDVAASGVLGFEAITDASSGEYAYGFYPET
jgi:hypothetical protein